MNQSILAGIQLLFRTVACLQHGFPNLRGQENLPLSNPFEAFAETARNPHRPDLDLDSGSNAPVREKPSGPIVPDLLY